jgi:hypothetical protein
MIRRQQLEDVVVIILIKVKYKDGRHWVKARWVVMEFPGYCQKCLVNFIAAVESEES